MTRDRPAWAVLAAVACVAAAWNVVGWVRTAASQLPAGYGEGAVVHAGQILARGGDPYAAAAGGFVSANYPPLGYALVAIGLPVGPFFGLRVANLVAAVAVAVLVAWLARARPLVAVALGASFLALYPVGAWVGGDRVDPPAVALAAFAVVALSPSRSRPWLFGVLGALALAAKPTAALPLAAVLLVTLARDRRAGARATLWLAASVLAVGALLVARFDARGMYEHLVVYNAFGYSPANVALLLVLGALLLGVFALAALRAGEAWSRAYVAGALGVLLLVGHEGATINYLLDLAAASCVAIAAVPASLPRWVAPALAGQLLATFVLVLGPFASPATAAQDARVALLADLPRSAAVYAEDSGLLVANALEPIVDDAFVWARLVDYGVVLDEVTPRVEARGFAAVVSDVPLDALAAASEVERARWPARLVDAVLRNYALEGSVPGAYRYAPRP